MEQGRWGRGAAGGCLELCLSILRGCIGVACTSSLGLLALEANQHNQTLHTAGSDLPEKREGQCLWIRVGFGVRVEFGGEWSSAIGVGFGESEVHGFRVTVPGVKVWFRGAQPQSQVPMHTASRGHGQDSKTGQSLHRSVTPDQSSPTHYGPTV